MKGARFNRVLYLGLADAIERARDKTMSQDEIQGIDLAAKEIADAFASVSQGFDRELFLKNCGVKS